MPGSTSTTALSRARRGPDILERIIDGAMHHRPAAPLDRVPAALGSDPLASPATSKNTMGRSHFQSCCGNRRGRGQPAEVPVRFPGNPRRRPGADDGRDRRARSRRSGRVGVRGAPPGSLPAPSAVGAIPPGRVGQRWQSFSTTSTWWSRCTATAALAAAPSCWQAVATASSPPISPPPPKAPRVSPRHGARRDSARTARGAPGQSGEPGPRWRGAARTVAAGPRDQPAQPATRRRRPLAGHVGAGTRPRRSRAAPGVRARRR